MSENILIAKIVRGQTIIVAIIGAFSALGVAYITGFLSITVKNTINGETTQCYQSIYEFGNVDTLCVSKEGVSGAYIFHNLGIEPARCISSGKKVTSSDGGILFLMNKGKCDNNLNRPDHEMKCIASPIGGSLTCEVNVGSTKVTEIYEPIFVK